jgi:photosystem II stability/assembly factor-like uncharacterized protein
MGRRTRSAMAFLAAVVSATDGLAQWTPQSSGTTASLRGISAVSAHVAWASGSRGTVLRTTDGGNTWQPVNVPGADSLDFRDVEAFDDRRAYVLSIGNGRASRIYKTEDGGQRWTLQFTNTDTTAFFDCLAFWDANNGMAVSDPVGGRLVLLSTSDGGERWVQLDSASSPVAQQGEGAFAASGTCLVARARRSAWIATAFGARVLRTTDRGRSWKASATPLASGAAPKGVFSLAFADTMRGVAVGGDYERPTDSTRTAAYTLDGGATWLPSARQPRGFRSGAAWIPGRSSNVVAVGTNGSDLSLDGGRSWSAIDNTSLNAAAFAADGSGWAVGPRGVIVKWSPKPPSH